MKAKEVLKILQISRVTLTKYVKEQIVKVRVLPNGRYDYDEESVYKLTSGGNERKTYIYARVFNQKDKKDLNNQIEALTQFCFSNGYKVQGIYADIASGINFDKRSELFYMLEDVVNKKVKRIVIMHKDRLSRVSYELFKNLFEMFNTEIVVMSEIVNTEVDNNEIFEEIVNLLNCYPINIYGAKSKQKIKDFIEEEIEHKLYSYNTTHGI